MDTDQQELEYRRLYWQHNEYQLIGGGSLSVELHCEIDRLATAMARITESLGYTPEA
jgi:hypothetical protein